MHGMQGEVFAHLLYTISAEVHFMVSFIICSYTCHANTPRFSRVREDAKRKRH